MSAPKNYLYGSMIIRQKVRRKIPAGNTHTTHDRYHTGITTCIGSLNKKVNGTLAAAKVNIAKRPVAGSQTNMLQ
jgi:hypothetical protein